MCVWIPVTLIFFLAMCFLSACRATGTTQIVAWAGTLTLAYHSAYGMCLCFAKRKKGRFEQLLITELLNADRTARSLGMHH